MQLVACAQCRRHIRANAGRCPFCGAASQSLLSRVVDHTGRFSRAAIFAGLTACYTNTPSPHAPPPPPPPPPDDTQTIAPDSTATFAQPPPGDPNQQQAVPATGAILGNAFDGDSNRPLTAEWIVLQGNGVSLKARADDRGNFAFRQLPDGEYQVRLAFYNGNPHQGPPTAYAQIKSGSTEHVTLQTPRYVPDRGPCCKPYGAPPARRRIV